MTPAAAAITPATICLRPGSATAIADGRARFAAALRAALRGLPGDELPARVASLYTLCAPAQRATARRAVAAARGQVAAPAAAERRDLRLAALREQVLRITLDWPRLLPSAPAYPEAGAALRSCPLWRTDLDHEDRLAALPHWLEHRWLGEPPDGWLARHEDDPRRHASAWAARRGTPLARLLRTQAGAARGAATSHRALAVLDAPERELPPLASRMATAAAAPCSPAPLWRGLPADTGPWSRRADALRAPADNAWMRLISRLVDVLRLAGADGDGWLSHGALALGAGVGLAWSETARGLLLHRVELAPDTSVAACDVLAPTDWNLHPQGAFARGLARLQGDTAAADAARLAVAFDPCAEFAIEEPACTS